MPLSADAKEGIDRIEKIRNDKMAKYLACRVDIFYNLLS